jgi:5-methylcytosine-specific restriction endonuclease McrA
MANRNSLGRFVRGHVGYKAMLGKKLSLDARMRMSIARKGKKKPKLSIARKGIKLSDKHKQAISKALMGRVVSLSTRDKIRKAHLGKKISEEHRLNMSKVRLGKPNYNLRGKNCHFWKGGVSPKNRSLRKSLEHKNWSRLVFSRDNYTCQKCGSAGGELHAHHKYNFSEHLKVRFDPDNGITFCSKCHKSFHEIYGLRGNNPEQVNNYVTMLK